MKDQTKVAYTYLSVPLLLLGVFAAIPIVSLFYLGFTFYDGISAPKWAGLNNYIKIFLRDDTFHLALRNVFFYLILLYLPVVNLVAFSFALFLNSIIKGRNFLMTAFYVPVITAPIAMALLWTYLYNPQFGLFNALLMKLGLPPQPWLTEVSTAMPSIVLMEVWKYAGWYMIMWFAGLQGIPEHLYEAARIDGAGKLARLFYITLPSLRPITLFIIIMGVIGAFQTFGEIYVMTFGGPADATQVPAFQIYIQAFSNWKLGYAATQSIILFAIVFCISILNLKFGKGYYAE